MKYLLLFLLPLQLFAQSSVTIRHVNIVDTRTGAIHQNQLVIIRDNKIDEISLDSNKSVIQVGNMIDGRNKYLIPGLWDMHTHMAVMNEAFKKDFAIPLLLANGVTGIRIMWGCDIDLRLRDSVNKNLLVAPRMIVGTPLLEGPGSIFSFSYVIPDASKVPHVVDSFHKAGYDFMKVYSFMRSDIYFPFAKYCRGHYISFEGHMPIGITATEASDAGQASIEHLFGLRKSYAPDAKKLCTQWEKESDTAQGTLVHLQILDKSEFDDLPYDEKTAKQVAATLRKNHTAVTPTIAALRGVSYDPDALKQLPEMQYADADHVNQWKVRYVTLPENAVEKTLQQVRFLHQQGVFILAATDNENPYTIHGFSLHTELEWYQQAGLSALEALQTATLNPAMFLHKENELGTVEKGKLADLVLLDKNPLDDIKNTREINAVIMNGHYISNDAINVMLDTVRAKAAK
jgi:hypothetical protein